MAQHTGRVVRRDGPAAPNAITVGSIARNKPVGKTRRHSTTRHQRRAFMAIPSRILRKPQWHSRVKSAANAQSMQQPIRVLASTGATTRTSPIPPATVAKLPGRRLRLERHPTEVAQKAKIPTPDSSTWQLQWCRPSGISDAALNTASWGRGQLSLPRRRVRDRASRAVSGRA
jgi:hypothetical protein